MILDIKEDEDGELYIELPPKMIEDLGWDENSVLIWTVNDDGTIGIRKKDDPSYEA